MRYRVIDGVSWRRVPYLSVGGCGEGRFVVHYQVLPLNAATRLVTTPELVGTGTRRGLVPYGTSMAHGACDGTTQGPEEAHWFVTCGSQPQTFSLCQSDGATFSRQNAYGLHDPVLHLRSLAWSDQVACSDNAFTLTQTGCAGTGGDTSQRGSRIAGAVTPRGINVIYVEDRTGNVGMDYTLHHVVR